MNNNVVYAWRPNCRRDNVDPQVVGEALEALVDQGPVMSAEQILAAAEPPTSPLHPLFEWEDDVAAHHWRVHEARELVRDLRVTIVTVDGEVQENTRAFINVIQGDQQGYTTAIRVASDATLMRQVMMAALDDLNAWRRRYAHLKGLATIFAAIDEVVIPDPPELPDDPGPAGGTTRIRVR